jgi:hypothetical protein
MGSLLPSAKASAEEAAHGQSPNRDQNEGDNQMHEDTDARREDCRGPECSARRLSPELMNISRGAQPVGAREHKEC